MSSNPIPHCSRGSMDFRSGLVLLSHHCNLGLKTRRLNLQIIHKKGHVYYHKTGDKLYVSMLCQC